MPWVWVRRPRRRRPRGRRLPPPPPPPPPRRLLRARREEESGIDLGDIAKYGGAAALGAGAALLWTHRDKILDALRGKEEEASEDDVRKVVEEVLKEQGVSLSEEEKEEVVKKVLEELKGG